MTIVFAKIPSTTANQGNMSEYIDLFSEEETVMLRDRYVFRVSPDRWEGLRDIVSQSEFTAKIVEDVKGAPLTDGELLSRQPFSIGNKTIGGSELITMAGPCAVETEDQMMVLASVVAAAGASVLRGGAFKPRTSPHDFQGIELRGLEILSRAGKSVGLPVVTEVVDVETLESVAEYGDVLQIGARNGQNFTLLVEAGRTGMPVLLKRGFGCTIAEWLGAAEYILNTGNDKLILCERGIRTFESATRFTLDLSGAAYVRQTTHLPVIVDPSHSTGDPALVGPMSRAAIAAGLDGLLTDVHFDPNRALCDGKQAVSPDEYATIVDDVRRVGVAIGRGHLPVDRAGLSAATQIAQAL